MARQNLTPQQEEQIKIMRKEGKSPKEVVEFFKATYQISMPLWKISYITGKGAHGLSAGAKSSNKQKHDVEGDDIVAIAKEIAELPKKIEAVYLRIFKRQRKDLVVALARAQKIEGEPVDGE
jgi:hypothetical protein